MSMTNKNRALTGFVWRLAERIGAQGITFVVSVILARLLDPTVYGTIALVTVFTTILQVFCDSGMGNALIQKKNADDLDFSSVFYFNIVLCVILYLGIFGAAPLIADFYQDQSLIPIIRVLCLTILISGVRNVQQAYISRRLLFKKFFLATLGGTISGGVVGLVMAYTGYGVWALVGQQLTNSLVGTILLWFIVHWRPSLVFSLQRLKGLLQFGWKLLASSLLDTVYNDLRQLIIGKYYTTTDLAFYNKGNEFPKLAINSINTSIDSVLLPTMAQEQDNRERVKAIVRRSIRTSTYVIAPMMIGLAACAESFVRLLLTEKWLDCVLFLRIFCVTYMFYPFHTANLNAIKAMGRSDCFLRLEIVKKVVGLILMFATIFISVEAMAYSLLASAIISTFINTFPNKQLLGYSWAEQMRDILPNLLLALVMGVPVLLMQYLPLPVFVTLVAQVVVGAAIYIGLSAILKIEIFQYLLGIAKEYIGKVRKA